MITQARLKEVLYYDQETGRFTWKKQLSSRGLVGQVAGTVRRDGYVKISVDGEQHYAHRLAWLYVTGSWVQEIDHKNRTPYDNSWTNLRKATTSQNRSNLGIRSNNKTGIRGVRKDPRSGGLIAQVAFELRVFQKRFRDIDVADEWAEFVRQELHGEFHHVV